MTKRGDLTAALRQVTGGQDAPSVAVAFEPPEPQEIDTPARSQLSRIGKHQISGYFEPGVRKQLKRLALDRDLDNQELLREALNDLFVKHHLPPIA